MNLLGDCEIKGRCCCGGKYLFVDTIRSWTLVNLVGVVKSRSIAAVAGRLVFNTIRSWTTVHLLGDCVVEGNYCCSGKIILNTICSWTIVDLLGDGEVVGCSG